MKNIIVVMMILAGVLSGCGGASVSSDSEKAVAEEDLVSENIQIKTIVLDDGTIGTIEYTDENDPYFVVGSVEVSVETEDDEISFDDGFSDGVARTKEITLDDGTIATVEYIDENDPDAVIYDNDETDTEGRDAIEEDIPFGLES